MALDYINIRSLTLEELVGLVNLYPWFGAARRELCERMVRSGGEGWGKEQFANAALYIGTRSIISDIVRSARKTDWKDKDVDALLKSFIAPKEEEPKSDVRVVGGDFVSGAKGTMCFRTMPHAPRKPLRRKEKRTLQTVRSARKPWPKSMRNRVIMSSRGKFIPV